jgi:hypothetical protein
MNFLSDPSFREELNRRMAPIRARQPQTRPVAQLSIKNFMELDREDNTTMLDANLTLFRLDLERGADPNAQRGPNRQAALHAFAMMGPAPTFKWENNWRNCFSSTEPIRTLLRRMGRPLIRLPFERAMLRLRV